jgi:hypothetical protein
MSKRSGRLLAALLVVFLSVVTLEAQQAGFTYQGKLMDNGSAANGNYDLQFALFDSSTGGSQIGQTQIVTNVLASGGVFTVTLDFGQAAFSGGSRFLEISTRPSGTGAFSLLTPRQGIASTPYAVRSLSAATADTATNAQQLGGAGASQYVQTGDARLSDSRPPTAGSASYIQNTTSQQTASNFSISGNGTAAGTLSGNIVNASTQYNLNGNRAFAITGGVGSEANTNTFVGVGTGASTTPSSSSDSGSNNSFFGAAAGAANTTGSQNAFFGTSAGQANTTGVANSFFGRQAGFSNTTGSINSFFGNWAGISNTTGNLNSFFGHRAGWHNTSGSYNIIFGYDAGQSNTTGNANTFIGTQAGGRNVIGNSNTYLGIGADGTTDLNNATAIGAHTQVTQSNSLVLGSINGVNGATADTNVGIGTNAPQARLHVVGNVGLNGNVGIGTTAPSYRLHVVDPVNRGLRVENGVMGGTVASFGNAGDFKIDALNSPGGRFSVKENGNVGIGTDAPSTRLDVDGGIRFSALASGGNVNLCWNNLNGRIASCSSSLRYKTDFRPFNRGLNLVQRLQPITFKWKSDQSLDLGLGAEDVAAIEPLLVTHNQNGEIEGVKYDRVAVVLINAVKEQQLQIERQRAEIDELKKLVCKSRRSARVCK